jgi:cyclopropane fatty-acyl-phospholipid synthase-like methyltransferase
LGSLVKSQDSIPLSLRIENKAAYVKDLKERPLAENTIDANKQHYEVPVEFFEHVMGPWKKYSAGLWPEFGPTQALIPLVNVTGTNPASRYAPCTLDDSEAAALKLVCARARLQDLSPGSRVLDMGCGWGSFSLYCATNFPQLKIISVSNSATQKEYIVSECVKRGLRNVEVITADINVFDGGLRGFDRVVSIEMMEHVKNYDLLLSRVSSWMRPGGLLFVHIFTHKHTPFHYTDGWMAEKFFTGGQMPSDDLLLFFQKDLHIVDRWIQLGSHYERTLNEWLQKMDSKNNVVMPVLEKTYGKDQALLWYVNWRIFFMSCAELFGFNHGSEWVISHYLFEK